MGRNGVFLKGIKEGVGGEREPQFAPMISPMMNGARVDKGGVKE